MLTLQIQDELETQLLTLAKQEHTTPELFIQKLINQYSAITKKEDFFSTAGLWQDRDIPRTAQSVPFVPCAVDSL